MVTSKIKHDLKNPDYYFNRELSLLDFQERVLKEAESYRHPLLERLKFISILSSNLDEFFMIRVAGLKSQMAAGVLELSYDGKTPKQQLSEIRNKLIPLYKRQEQVLNENIMPKLRDYGVVVHNYESLSKPDKLKLKDYFYKDVLPILTPLSLGPANPFPRLINRSLNVGFILKDQKEKSGDKKIAFLQIPGMLERFVKLNWKSGHQFVLIEEIIIAFSDELFPGYDIIAASTFRVTRDADVEIAEDEAEDLLSEISEQVKQRRWGRAAVRLEVSAHMPEYLANLLRNSLDLEWDDVYVYNRPLNLPDFMDLRKLDLNKLKDTPFATKKFDSIMNADRIFDAVRENDYMMHHPFDSFTNSTLKFINEAAVDPKVVVIKITLYRTGMNSGIVAALKKAAENGKSVTAFVELKARFDEENNIVWAKELEQTGVHVVYGIPGLKTHCKIAIVVRREVDKMKTYLHLATGNYNQVTARLYTDMGLLTSNEDFAIDGTHLFNYLTGYSHHNEWKHFVVAPTHLYKKTIEYIEREIEKHTPENPGLIIAKTNSLAHREVIPALYRASQKGVKVKLIVRGICCLKPGVPGLSENIEVRSILGRFLEHHRIFYFKNGGAEEYYLSSADWMSRNLHRRVEVMFPVLDKKLKKDLKNILDVYLNDNARAWILQSDGKYKRLVEDKSVEFCTQEYFLNNIDK